jgi:arylsulfatase
MASAAIAIAQAATGKKPNVIVIFSNDVGWGDLGAYGGITRGAPTPNLDRMAAEGARLTTWYGQASFTAGHATLITERLTDSLCTLGCEGPGTATICMLTPQ